MKDKKVLEEARRLVDRGIISPKESPILRRAGLILLANGRQLTHDDHRVLTFCRGAWGRGWNQEPKPPAPTPLDAEVSELEKQDAEATAKHEEATECMWQAAFAWARLAGENSLVEPQLGGITFSGLLPDKPNPTSIPAGEGWTMPKPRKPPNPVVVAEAREKVRTAIRERNEAQRVHKEIRVKLNRARIQQSRWRATAEYTAAKQEAKKNE